MTVSDQSGVDAHADTQRADAEQTHPQQPDGPGWPVGRVVLGGLLVLVGVLWLLDATGIVDLRWRLVLPAALTLVGLGLLASVRRGAHGGLIAAGLVLSALVLVSSGVPAITTGLGGLGERTEHPTAAVEAEAGYGLGMGTLTVDLREVTDLDEATEVAARVGMGELVVVLPEGTGAEIDARAGAGEVEVLGASRSGVGVSVTEVVQGRPTVDLDLSVGMGTVTVEVRR